MLTPYDKLSISQALNMSACHQHRHRSAGCWAGRADGDEILTRRPEDGAVEVAWWLITNYGPSGEIGPARSGSQRHSGTHPDEFVCVLILVLFEVHEVSS